VADTIDHSAEAARRANSLPSAERAQIHAMLAVATSISSVADALRASAAPEDGTTAAAAIRSATLTLRSEPERCFVDLVGLVEEVLRDYDATMGGPLRIPHVEALRSHVRRCRVALDG